MPDKKQTHTRSTKTQVGKEMDLLKTLNIGESFISSVPSKKVKAYASDAKVSTETRTVLVTWDYDTDDPKTRKMTEITIVDKKLL